MWRKSDLNKMSGKVGCFVSKKENLRRKIIVGLTTASVLCSSYGTNITYANVKSHPSKNVGTIEMGIEIDTIDTLRRVINNLQALPDVYCVKRVPAISHNKQEKSDKHAQKQTKKQKK